MALIAVRGLPASPSWCPHRTGGLVWRTHARLKSPEISESTVSPAMIEGIDCAPEHELMRWSSRACPIRAPDAGTAASSSPDDAALIGQAQFNNRVSSAGPPSPSSLKTRGWRGGGEGGGGRCRVAGKEEETGVVATTPSFARAPLTCHRPAPTAEPSPSFELVGGALPAIDAGLLRERPGDGISSALGSSTSGWRRDGHKRQQVVGERGEGRQAP
ncbi:hypothetical protein PR202_gb29019 [Eleusine coracana subsp. coracana]|uniref:Uncharacterized protein n=1 Tax=Eleusine coracana subsp. coracana TaxID=191504 RepID=A0AAV5G099_ELECO|nr:hypothetical protein PR202_gb29019 [Eleusine coracana subsp. coracana]